MLPATYYRHRILSSTLLRARPTASPSRAPTSPWRGLVLDLACRNCGRVNSPRAKFCSTCGSSLVDCPRCGIELQDTAGAFCNNCGAALVTPPGSNSQARRVDNTLAWTIAFAP